MYTSVGWYTGILRSGTNLRQDRKRVLLTDVWAKLVLNQLSIYAKLQKYKKTTIID